jgi:hypothetical protein
MNKKQTLTAARKVNDKKKKVYTTNADKVAAAIEKLYNVTYDAVYDCSRAMAPSASKEFHNRSAMARADGSVSTYYSEPWGVLDNMYQFYVRSCPSADRKPPKSKYLGFFNNPRVAALVYAYITKKEIEDIEAEMNENERGLLI